MNCKLCRRCMHFWVKSGRTALVLLCTMTLDLSPLTHLVLSDWCRWHELGCKEGREIPCVSTRLQTAGSGSHSGGLGGEQIYMLLNSLLLSNNFLTSLRCKFCLHKKKILEVFSNLVLVKISCGEPVIVNG